MKIIDILTRLGILTVLLLTVAPYASATHNRSGQITFEHLFGNTYRFTVTTCTKSSSEADRPELEIFWGDGNSDTIPRANIDIVQGYDAQKNFYYGTHTYAGPGDYIVEVVDPNRNAGIENIYPNSVNVPFCIQTKIIISPFAGTNNSPIFSTCPCPEYGCTNIPYNYNVGAYDPDGDSLGFEIVPCRGGDCAELSIPGRYTYPNTTGSSIGTFTINQQGTLTWDSPTITGEFNFAILVSEYRNGVLLSTILHDVQVTIQNCSNLPPRVQSEPDTCVFAGDSIIKEFTSVDTSFSSPSNQVILTADGEPFDIIPNSAEFNVNHGSQTPSMTTGTFRWKPRCSEVRESPYNVFFTTYDNDPSQSFQNSYTWRVKVNAPPPENLTVIPQGNKMALSWTPPQVCNNVSGYNIYMSTDSTVYNGDCCPDGGPESLGYTQIGSTENADSTDFLTDELIIGNKFCFMITAVLDNGSESCPSKPDCDELLFEIPVMTNVSVINTDASSGSDSVIWATPKELQTATFPAPYHYKLYRSPGLQPNNEQLILTTPDQPDLFNNDDTLYLDQGLNTVDSSYSYSVELYSNGNLVGKSTAASSIYLTITPNDNQLLLEWEEDVPWNNNSYEVYRETSPGSGNFNLIGTTTDQEYLDQSLVNRKEYCYRIKSIGEYTSDGIVDPIINFSQVVCKEPYDNTAPCAPELSIDPSCEDIYNNLNWTNPNNNCADDVTRYSIYYTPVKGEPFELLTTISSSTDTSFRFEDMGTIAGCFYVTATDSMPYDNESDSSNIICVDNCPVYELPNVFSPNGDGDNDLFHPLLPYRYIEGVKFTVFDRWGLKMFYTEDPDLNWDGTNQQNGKKLPDGVYFYICEVRTIRLTGIETITLQGYIHLYN